MIHTSVHFSIKLQIQLMAAIKGFNRFFLSFQKKYNYIKKKNKTDKMANEISRTDRKQECRWFNKMNE